MGINKLILVNHTVGDFLVWFYTRAVSLLVIFWLASSQLLIFIGLGLTAELGNLRCAKLRVPSMCNIVRTFG